MSLIYISLLVLTFTVLISPFSWSVLRSYFIMFMSPGISSTLKPSFGVFFTSSKWSKAESSYCSSKFGLKGTSPADSGNVLLFLNIKEKKKLCFPFALKFFLPVDYPSKGSTSISILNWLRFQKKKIKIQ